MYKKIVEREKQSGSHSTSKANALRLSYRVITFLGLEPAIKFSSLCKSKHVGGNTGGVSVTPEMHTRELRMAGIDATLLVPNPGLEKLPKNHYYSFIKTPIPLNYSVQQLMKETDLLNEVSKRLSGFDVIKVNHGLAASIILALKRKGGISQNTKIIYGDIMWGRNIAHVRDLSLVRDSIEQEILKTADKIVVYTKAEKKLIERNYSDVLAPDLIDKKIVTIPLGVNHDEVNCKSRRSFRIKLRKSYLKKYSGSTNFFMLARLDALKGHKEAVMAFCQALNEHPGLDISLSLFGDISGERNKGYYGEICDYINSQPEQIRSRILFHGSQPTIHALAVGDVFIGPSKFEMWYLAANEATACSLPTILSDTPIMKEIYGEDGCFVEPNNINTIKDAIIKMASDIDYRKKIAKHNYRYTKKYTWRNSAITLNRVIKNVVNTETSSDTRVQTKTISPIVAAYIEVLRGYNSDLTIYQYIENLRSEVEPIECYRKIKSKAKKEIATLTDDVLSKLLQKTIPFIDALPTAHSKGHLARDLVNLNVILHDPEIGSYDDLEILVGLLAGVFHDIGNSIIDRDEEAERFTLHAEVGAWVFGKLAEDILPPNITKLVQFAIAAHTNFENARIITRNGKTVKFLPYDAEIINGNKWSTTLARATDRTDLINGAIYPVRTTIRFAKCIKQVIHVTGEKDIESENEVEDFRTRFCCDKTRKGTLLHDLQYLANNNKYLNIHNKYDTNYFKNKIFLPNTQDLQRFIDTVVDYKDEGLESANSKSILERYLNLCELLEPGIDICERSCMLRRKFYLLPKNDQKRWIAGFRLLTDELYPQYYTLTKNRIASVPAIVYKRGGKLQIIIKDLIGKANKVLEVFNPNYISEDPNLYPEILERLTD